MSPEDLYVAECDNGHTYQQSIDVDPDEYPCPFCGAKASYNAH